MTTITKLPKEQYILFCPGCGRKRPESRDEAIEQHDAGHGDCCNPQCQGEWGTGCYHCHHPQYWPAALYKIVARLRSKKASRTVISYMRQHGSPGGAELEFTTKLKQVLLVEHGLRWHIEVWETRASKTLSPGSEEKIVATYDHYARGATVYHDPVSTLGEESNTHQDPLPPVNTMTQNEEAARKMTQEEALQALRVYVSQQVEVEALDIIDMVIERLTSNPGEQHMPNQCVRILIGQTPVDYNYNIALQHAEALKLGKLTPPKWLERFQKLVTEIREEFDLHRPPVDDGEHQ